ncbi:hypothetical protein [uncultured Polaribacter sp.]|uniref:hypothetical protein n=1 Tax=uncultured Polaribacter sp. TaxID=174711 RepID=UPI0026052CA4|nr:hypothetical protein [uncultured Polaribacter sp.]
MDENTSKAIFNLMQKVVDKLDAISKEVNKKEPTELENIIKKTNVAIAKLVPEIVKTQSKLLLTSSVIREEIINYIKENKITPTVNNHTEYSLLGNKSHFKPWVLGVFFFGLITFWCSIKYLPSYFIEKSLLSKEREEYQLFYNYVYLKQFKNDEPNIAGETLKKVKQKDTLFMKEYHILLNTYQREIRKQELKEELNSLDNNDN